MSTKSLSKATYSEWVVRNALYWLSPLSRWKLDETENHWQITFGQPGDEVDQELSRLLNDYLLRERVMVRTDDIRQSIISSVLVGIQDRVSK